MTKPEKVKIIQIQSYYHTGNRQTETHGLGDDGKLYWFEFKSSEWKQY